MKLAELFREEPEAWGLRGDPGLWQAMERRFSTVDLPDNAAELVRRIEDGYRDLTGQAVENDECVYVEEFAQGGLSSGQVSPEFWRSTAIPLLVARFGEAVPGRERQTPSSGPDPR